MKRQVTEIEITKKETLIVSRTRHPLRPLLCRECGLKTMLHPEDAAAILQIGLRDVFRRIEAAAMHFEEFPDGSIYVCTM